MSSRLTRDRIIDALRDLPPDSGVADAIERLAFLAKIEEGLAQLDGGEGISHDEVKRRLGSLDVSEVETTREGDCLTLRPRGKEWGAYFDSPTRGSLPERRELPLDERNRILWRFPRHEQCRIRTRAGPARGELDAGESGGGGAKPRRTSSAHIDRLPAPRVHLQVRLLLQRLDRDQRLAIAGGEADLRSPVGAGGPDLPDQRAQLGA